VTHLLELDDVSVTYMTAGGEVPAVALTAYARAQDRTQAILAGFQSHLSKPVDPTELIATVASLAGRGEAK